MKDELYLLFCESPFQANNVDEDFEDQYVAAIANGFKTLFFSFDDLVSTDKSSIATKRIKPTDSQTGRSHHPLDDNR
ncbi:MAG: hypothetical protein HYZ51_03105 [Candidatus Doudnabacteria bacterium]|nr:hypothetical protein [Candidatus Doudnabacteria bacterium]